VYITALSVSLYLILWSYLTVHEGYQGHPHHITACYIRRWVQHNVLQNPRVVCFAQEFSRWVEASYTELGWTPHYWRSFSHYGEFAAAAT